MPDLRRLRTRAAAAVKYGGASVLGRILLHRFFSPLVRWQMMFIGERDLSLPIPEIRTRIPVHLRFLSAVEARRFRPVFESQGLAWTTVEERLKRGDRCAAALAADRLLYFQWVAFHVAWIPELHAALHLDEGEVWGYNAAAVSEARGNNLHPAGIAFVMRRAKECGYHRYLSYVRTDNFSSRRAAAKVPRDWRLATRRLEVAGLPGAFLVGLDPLWGRRLAFPPSATTRGLGRRILWVNDATAGKPAAP